MRTSIGYVNQDAVTGGIGIFHLNSEGFDQGFDQGLSLPGEGSGRRDMV
jgi:hypothetical protein